MALSRKKKECHISIVLYSQWGRHQYWRLPEAPAHSGTFDVWLQLFGVLSVWAVAQFWNYSKVRGSTILRKLPVNGRVCVCVCVPQSAMMLTVVGPLARWRDLAAFFSPRCRSALSAILPSHLSLFALSLSLSLNLLRPTWSFILLSVSLTLYLLLSFCHTVSLSAASFFLLVFNCEFICVNVVDVTVIKTECALLSSWVGTNKWKWKQL